MNSDDTTKQSVPVFGAQGAGHAVTQMCHYCGKPRHQLGSRVIKRGPLRMFKCAVCIENEASAKSTTPQIAAST